MGSGSRIDHQGHAIAPSAPTAAAAALPPIAQIPAVAIAGSLADTSADGDDGAAFVYQGPHVEQALGAGSAVRIRTHAYFPPDGTGEVLTGAFLMRRDGEQLRADLVDAACSCAAPEPCRHMRAAVDTQTRALAADPDERARIRAAHRAAAAEVAGEHARAEQARAAAISAWPRSEVDYTTDAAAFEHAYAAARVAIDAGVDPVPYFTEDATGGLGDRETGRGFGIEIEFDFTAEDHARGVIFDLGEDLHAQGLIPTPYQRDYHAAADDGYSDDPFAWSLETDSTVDGEMVSPILYDTPATWANLAAVCETLRRHGAHANYNTGGHIHVSLRDFDHMTGCHGRLLESAAAHEDVLFRLAQNPAGSYHRGLAWCAPNMAPAAGFGSADLPTLRHLASHGTMVNLASARGRASDHVEFRLWDGTLNPGVIQTQVKLSLGLTAAAFRNGGEHPARPRTPLGTGLGAWPPASRDPRSAAWRSETAGFRALMDEVFHRTRDKAQATALFAATAWQSTD